jgi:hypothetical protein
MPWHSLKSVQDLPASAVFTSQPMVLKSPIGPQVPPAPRHSVSVCGISGFWANCLAGAQPERARKSAGKTRCENLNMRGLTIELSGRTKPMSAVRDADHSPAAAGTARSPDAVRLDEG